MYVCACVWYSEFLTTPLRISYAYTRRDFHRDCIAPIAFELCVSVPIGIGQIFLSRASRLKVINASCVHTINNILFIYKKSQTTFHPSQVYRKFNFTVTMIYRHYNNMLYTYSILYSKSFLYFDIIGRCKIYNIIFIIW